jgi:preprotein translocase subunit SecG
MLLNLLLATIIIIAVAMVGVILMQRSEGGALGMSGGGPGNFMSARGTGDLLSRTTQILAGAFFILCLLMTLIGGHEHAKSSIVNANAVGQISTTPAQPRPQPQQQQAPTGSTQPLPAPSAPIQFTPPAKPAPNNPLDLFGPGTAPAPKGK